MVDAPVSGGEAGAVEGSLSIMVGGAEADVERARPLLAAMGRTIVRVGPAGAGQTVKAANQLLVAGTIELVAEAIVFLEAHGVDTTAAVEVLSGGLAGNAILDPQGAEHARPQLHPRLPGRAAPQGHGHRAPPPPARPASRSRSAATSPGSSRALEAQGHGRLDHGALLLLVDQLSGRTGDRTESGDDPDACGGRRGGDPGQGGHRHRVRGARRGDQPALLGLRADGGIRHYLARHVEGAAHMAEGYSRAAAGNIGLCIGTSGPGGTDMITGLYSAWGDSVPLLCITGQAPVAKLHKEDFQAVDIAAIATPVTKLAVTVMEGAQVPGTLQRAFHTMRSGRPGPVLVDLPLDVQLTEIDFDIDTYEPLPVHRPAMTAAQAARVLDLLASAHRPLIVAGGGVVSADAAAELVELAELLDVPVVPTLMGWGAIPDDHRLMAGMAGIQTAHRYGNATLLAADFVLGIGNRWANRHTGGLDTYRAGRTFVHVDIEPTQIGKIFTPDYGVVSDAKAALRQLVAVARERSRGRPAAGGSRSARSARRPCTGVPTSTTSRSSRSGSTRR